MDMEKICAYIIFSLLVSVLANSGCIENTKPTAHGKKKKISMDAIKVSQNTTGTDETNESGTMFMDTLKMIIL